MNIDTYKGKRVRFFYAGMWREGTVQGALRFQGRLLVGDDNGRRWLPAVEMCELADDNSAVSQLVSKADFARVLGASQVNSMFTAQDREDMRKIHILL